MKTFIVFSLLSFSVFAQTGYIKDFNYQLTDIAQKGLKKEDLFPKMTRNGVDLENSICANRAHLWAYDFYRWYGINTGKIFIFFGSSIWEGDDQGWMYHVAPYIVENGKEYVMEASYDDVPKPLTVNEWISNETYERVSDCVEITAADTDLTEYFYARYNLPEVRANGRTSGRCYIRKVPGHYWFPTSIAYHDLRRDEDGGEVEFDPKGFDIDDVFDACVDAFSSRLGRWMGGDARAKCKKYLGIR
jgi:hypothetical protein